MAAQGAGENEPPAGLSAALADRYTVGPALGRGGMATVYAAEDLRHRRRVALKVLDPDLGAMLGAERFSLEIQVTANLQHPNLLPLFDSGEAAGLLYYVMPLIEGESLRARLEREPQLPVGEAVAMAGAILRALDYAHRHGVVHRDLKPENILLHDGQPVVADFGIALAVSAAGGARLTRTGMSIGTPQYMSPEQAAVDATIDGRSDIYSLACVLYEMLAGDPPFSGSTVQSVIAKTLTQVPASVRTVRPSVPPHVDAALSRALAKLPADRYATAREFADALVASTVVEGEAPKRSRVSLAVGAVLVILAGAGIYAASLSTDAEIESGPRATATAALEQQRPSIAVIPFRNTSGDLSDDQFSDGLADELIGSLGKLAGLKVAARTSSFALKGTDLGVRAIGDTLGVATVLEYSVRRASDRIKVTAQLVSATDGGVLWTKTYDREMKGYFTLQEELAGAIVTALRVKLGRPGERLVRPGTEDLAAYELYLKGKSASYRLTPADFQMAVSFFNQAIARDPAYAQAFAGLADVYVLRSVFGGTKGSDDLRGARAAADSALALDSTIAEAHVALASVLFRFDSNWRGAELEFKRAFELDPGYAVGYLRHGIFLFNQGKLEEAIRALERGSILDPLSPLYQMNLGRVHLRANRTDSAMTLLRQAALAMPGRAVAHQVLGYGYLRQGRNEDALTEFRRAAVLSGALDSAHLAYALGVTGRRAEAEAVVSALLSPVSRRYVHPLGVAVGYVGLNKPDSAFRWLDQAYAERAGLDVVKTILAFDALHADPRWSRLLARVGLEP